MMMRNKGPMIVMVVLAMLLLLTAIVWMAVDLRMASAAAEEQPIAVVTVCTERDDLMGRREPWIGSDVIVTCERGAVLSVYKAEGEWAYIITPDIGRYWVCTRYISSKTISENGQHTVTGDGRVIIRKSPDGEKTGNYVQPGDSVTVISWIGDWAYMDRGYVMGKYLEKQ